MKSNLNTLFRLTLLFHWNVRMLFSDRTTLYKLHRWACSITIRALSFHFSVFFGARQSTDLILVSQLVRGAINESFMNHFKASINSFVGLKITQKSLFYGSVLFALAFTSSAPPSPSRRFRFFLRLLFNSLHSPIFLTPLTL